MLSLMNVSKVFNPGTVNSKVALNSISLKINSGDFVNVIGSNGAGKSTLLNLIAGAYQADTGAIVLSSESINNQPEHKRAALMGRVFQDPMMGTAPSMTIEENMAMALARGKRRGLRRGVKPADRAMFREKLSWLGLGLEDRLTTKAGAISGGQRQALTLLMATLSKPKLLLLDEHTAALDPKTAEMIVELTERIVALNHLTTLMVTHNMEQALRLGNRLIMLDKGEVILDVNGSEKRRMTVECLLERFEILRGEKFVDDRVVLAN
jgi:putative ABC transport system ATP-binding protein